MRLQAPCKDCEGRRIGCHSECKLYIDFKNECKKVYDIREKHSERNLQDVKWLKESMKRMKRGKR